MTQVEYSLEVTINTGNFENVKPGWKIIDTVREGERVADAATRVKKMVDSLMEAEIADIKADL